MYAGRVVEAGPVAEIFARPRHAYTLGLLNSVPRGGALRQPLSSIAGQPPTPLEPAAGLRLRAALRLRRAGLRRCAAAALVVAPMHETRACLQHRKVAQR